ncbi:MAG: hypothetical protein E6600_18980 [Anaerocolumna aminovalerica]|jgi:hypothetical protein|uniref:hypothetical protein n=1 Tax=Anaerocolumna aminovalerica TaxID=1527 RepID=UPI00248B82E1|nr:hypothetical protein [Anaerocolumna aminovalerica]MDU6266580.1 hypothetical protein [Anaerocolumna aminovalerica]
MQKKTFTYFIYLIFIVVYSALSFILVKEKTNIFWCGYLFFVLAILISAVLTVISVQKLSSAFPIELSLITFSYVYVVITFLVNFIFGKVFVLSFSKFISIHIACLGLFAIITTLLMLTKGLVVKQNNEVKVQLRELQPLIQEVEKIKSKLPDLSANIRTPVVKMIDKVADRIRFSEYSSEEDIVEIDNRIRTKLGELQNEVFNMVEKQSENTKNIESYVNSILQLVDERNSQIISAKSGI